METREPADQGSQGVVWRMMDANRNRVMEGLRTLEDIARFQGLGSLQANYKKARHGLQEAFGGVDVAVFLASRDTAGDVGCNVKTPGEFERPEGLVSIAQAAASRVEQGLRVLEEGAKVVLPQGAMGIERVRYQVYDLNAALILGLSRDRDFLQGAVLYVLVDCRLPLDVFAERVQAISEGGVQWIQVRDKECTTQQLVAYTLRAMEVVDAKQTRIVVNDRVDVARAVQATAVHLGQEDLEVSVARRILEPRQMIGYSTHDLQQVQRGVALGVDYIGCGPTFVSQTKQFESFSGIAFLKQAAEWLLENEPGLPAYAIGGIQLENLDQVLSTGIRRVAVSHAIWRSSEPKEVAKRFRDRLAR